MPKIAKKCLWGQGKILQKIFGYRRKTLGIGFGHDLDEVKIFEILGFGGHRGYRGTIMVPRGKNFLKIEVAQKCVETRFLEFEGQNRKFSKNEQVSPLMFDFEISISAYNNKQTRTCLKTSDSFCFDLINAVLKSKRF